MPLDHGAVANETEGALFSIFQNAANHLSHLYSLSINQQRAAFKAGTRHSLVKLNEWLSQKLSDGQTVSVAEVIAYLEEKLNSGMEGDGDGQPQEGSSGSQGTESEAGGSTSGGTTQSWDGYPDDVLMETASDEDY